MINPYILLGIFAAIVGAGIAGGVGGYRYADAQCKAAELERRELIAEVRQANLDLANGISKDVETKLGKIRITNTTINKEVQHEREVHHVLDNPDCGVPPSTVGVLNRAVRPERADDRPAAPQPGGGLRLPGAAAKPAALGK